jgi:hypothetical protein
VDGGRVYLSYCVGHCVSSSTKIELEEKEKKTKVTPLTKKYVKRRRKEERRGL